MSNWRNYITSCRILSQVIPMNQHRQYLNAILHGLQHRRLGILCRTSDHHIQSEKVRCKDRILGRHRLSVLHRPRLVHHLILTITPLHRQNTNHSHQQHRLIDTAYRDSVSEDLRSATHPVAARLQMQDGPTQDPREIL